MAKLGVEKALFSAFQELGKVFGEDRVMNAAGHILQTAAQTKATVDGNVATVLGLAGLPSRSELDTMRRQLDVVQATLANLARKLDRLTDEVAHLQKEAHRPAAVPTKRTRRPRSDGTPG